MRKLKTIDLFAGIGGLSLGLEQTGGFETCLQVEIEEYPLKVLRTRWPNVKRWGDVRTLFAVGSPARTSLSPASESGLKVNAPVFGKRCGESFARYDPDSSSWKTSEGCFPWGSDEFSETWPSSGMMRNGRCFQLRPKGLRTAGTASSSWLTPTGEDAGRKGSTAWEKTADMRLRNQVKRDPGETWPTPRASDIKGCGPPGSKVQQHRLRKGYLDAHACEYGGKEGQLNPDWVDALMGFPVGWSDVECAKPEARDYRTRWQDGTWEDGLPRLTKRKDLRRQRLMALGNGVVPQCAETIGMAILSRVERLG